MPLFNREVIEIVNALERFIEAKYHQLAVNDEHGQAIAGNKKDDLVDVLVRIIVKPPSQNGK
jgi:hypothetical protein